MSNDLTDLLRAHERVVEASTEGMAPAAHGRARVLGRVRQVRRTRMALEVGGGLAVAAAVATGAMLLTGQDPVPPVGPTPSDTVPAPSATPSPTSSPSPTGTAQALPDPGFAGTVTVDPHLPSAEPITPEVWAQAASGWVLASYQERAYGAEGAVGPLGPQVVYLVSPDGVRYQLVEVQGGDVVRVVAWRPGATTALVQVLSGSGAEQPWARLDLVTGTWAPLAVPGDAWVTGTTLADGRAEVWLYGDQGSTRAGIDADGVVTPVDDPAPAAALAAVQADFPGYTCDGIGRVDQGAAAVRCVRGLDALLGMADTGASGDFDAVLLSVPDAGGPATLLAHVGPEQVDEARWDTLGAAAGVLVVDGAPGWAVDGGQQRWIVHDGALTSLPGPSAVLPEAPWASTAGWSGTSTYSWVHVSFQEDSATALVRDDLATGSSTVLVPFPADMGPDGLVSSLTGWYVVP